MTPKDIKKLRADWLHLYGPDFNGMRDKYFEWIVNRIEGAEKRAKRNSK